LNDRTTNAVIKVFNLLYKLNAHTDRAMAQAVSRRSPTAEARVRSRVSQCGICGGQRGAETGFFFPEYFSFPLSISFHRCSITRKNEETLMVFITRFHNKCQARGVSVASAAGPFTKKYTLLVTYEC
jgi:hypothetical protein